MPLRGRSAQKVRHREAHVSTAQQEQKADSRISRAKENARWSRGASSSARQGTQASLGDCCEEVTVAPSRVRPLGITKAMRLRERREFIHVQTVGEKVHGRHVLVICAPRSDQQDTGRLGITVTKKVGNAVIRNRIRRFVREWFRTNGWVPRGWDIVVVAKDSAARQLHPIDFAPDLTRALRQLT